MKQLSTGLKTPQKPYLEHIAVNRPVAEKMRRAAMECDAIILLVGVDLIRCHF
jgi:hypothetical protein